MGGAAIDDVRISRTLPAPAGPAREMTLSPHGDEVRLVHAAQSGDRGAYGELYRRYGRMVHGVLLARVPRGQVEDLVQDVFLQALRRLGTLREPERFGGWLAMIARNRATDFHRRGRDTVELTDDLPGAEPGPQAEAIAALDALRALP